MKKPFARILYTNATLRGTTRLLLLLLIIAGSGWVTVYGQSFSEEFSESYRIALEDSAVKFEYLKPKAVACDSLVKQLTLTLKYTNVAHGLDKKAMRIQAKLDSLAMRETMRVAVSKAVKTGRKQGIAIALVPPLLYLTLKSFFTFLR